jgi:hypothetical protein
MILGSLALLFIGIFAAWFWATGTRPMLAARAAGPLSSGICQLLTLGLVVTCAIGLLGWATDIKSQLLQLAFDVLAISWLLVVFVGYFDRYSTYLRITGRR